MKLELTEKGLLQALASAEKSMKEADEKAKKAKSDYLQIEAVMIGYMQDNEIKTTAKFEEFGHATLVKPKLHVQCNKADQGELIEFVEKIEREDCVVTEVPNGRLNKLIEEMIKNGDEIPEPVKYFFSQKVKIYGRKK